MVRTSENSNDSRRRIIELHNQGNRYRNISACLNIPISSVRNIIVKFKADRTTVNSQQTGKPKKLTARDC